ncbi:MAG: methylmalonyl-CoA epimerase [Desulfuromonas sp. SDB]|nr:MAG: methylmalonyl-CoA epimerase [Desulfuromonas sp. SDB]
MIQKINHLGIAVNNLDEQIPFYRDILKFEFLGIEEVSDQKVRVAIFQIGEVKIELLEPTAPDSPIAKYLDKKGPGIHHIAYQTDNIQHQIDQLTNQNINMIDQQPRTGAHQTKIAFIHPKSSGKILIELCQPSE